MTITFEIPQNIEQRVKAEEQTLTARRRRRTWWSFIDRTEFPTTT